MERNGAVFADAQPVQKTIPRDVPPGFDQLLFMTRRRK